MSGSATELPDHPLIGVRRVPHGALPYLPTDGPFVWQAVEVWRAQGSSFADAAAFLNVSEGAIRAAVAYHQAEGSGYEPRDRTVIPRTASATAETVADATSVLQRIGQALAVLAGLASIVYITGGVVLAARLARADLPWEPVVGQLPREFLISIGAGQVFLPVAAAAAIYALYRLLHRSGPPALRRLRSGDEGNARRWFAHMAALLAITGLTTCLGWVVVDEADHLSLAWWVGALAALAIAAAVVTECAGVLPAGRTRTGTRYGRRRP